MYLFREKWYIKGKGLDILEFFCFNSGLHEFFKRFGLYIMFLFSLSLSII